VTRFILAACAAIIVVTSTALLPRSAVLADGIDILPTTVRIDTAHRIATVMIANHDPGLHTYQITAYSWSQVDGHDKLTPTTDLVVSPPIFTVLSEGQQMVRFALRNAAPVASELPYRILLRAAPTDTQLLGSLKRISFSLPVFIASPQGGAAKLTCSYRDLGHNRVRLTLENSGTAHVHVLNVRLSDAHGVPVDASEEFYVLAGARFTLNLLASRPIIGEIGATITFDQGQAPVDVVVQRAG
jgi:fimbrial chaperone protein